MADLGFIGLGIMGNPMAGLGVSLPNTATTQELFSTISADGAIDLDHSAMITALEKLANHKVG